MYKISDEIVLIFFHRIVTNISPNVPHVVYVFIFCLWRGRYDKLYLNVAG